jgi:hypothetical protein
VLTLSKKEPEADGRMPKAVLMQITLNSGNCFLFQMLSA